MNLNAERTRVIKVLLILPDGHIHRIRIGRFIRSMREAPLTLTLLAALAPRDLEFSFRIADESVEQVPLDYPADLVGISVLTGTSVRAYELADHFRARGIPVVLGGVHVTIMPREAKLHADAIVVGGAERTWPRLLRDFHAGRLEPVYRNLDVPALEGLPMPRRDLQRRGAYMMPNTVMATRGCRHACGFCATPLATRGYAKRPVHEVVDEIRRIPGRLFAFNDVTLVEDVPYAKELFAAMAPLNKRWGGLATSGVTGDVELLDLMVKSGCRYLLIGFESFQDRALGEIHKRFNREGEYRHTMEILHSHGVAVQGCFIFGFDDDGPDVFASTVQRVLDLRMDIPRYAILTPFPRTPLFERLSAENRILTRYWANYDTMHVVFEPARMTPEELYAGFKWAYRETFKFSHILARTRSLKFTSLINMVGNVAYKRFVKRLYGSERYAAPFMAGPDFAAPAADDAPEVSLCRM